MTFSLAHHSDTIGRDGSMPQRCEKDLDSHDGNRESILGFAATSGIQATENAEIAEDRREPRYHRLRARSAVFSQNSLLRNLRRTENGPGWPISTRSKLNGIPEATSLTSSFPCVPFRVAHLGHQVSDQTVGNLLKRHDIPPAPEREKTTTWSEFALHPTWSL